MTRNIDYLTRLVSLVENVMISGDEIVTREKYYKLVGPRYNIIVNELNDKQVIMFDEYDGVRRVTSWEALEAYLEDARQELKDALKEEVRRDTDDKYKIKGILYGKISLWISGAALLFSLYVAFRQYGWL